MGIIIFLITFVAAVLFYKKYSKMGLIYLLIFLLPFRFELFSVGNVGVRITDVISIMVLVNWFFDLISQKIKKKQMQILMPILIFSIFIVFAFLLNVLKTGIMSNLVDIIRFLLAVMTGISVATSIKSKENLLKILSFWTLAATISSIVSIYTFLSSGLSVNTLFHLGDLSTAEFYNIKFSNSIFFEDPNNLATYLGISLFITIGLSKIRYVSQSKSIIYILLQSLGLYLTLSRSAYLSVAVVLALYWLLASNKTYRILVLKLGIVISSLFVLSYVINLLTQDVSAMSRFGLWKTGINMAIDNPIIGVGIGNSSVFFDKYVDANLLIYNPHFHNLYITVVAEFGAVGFTLFFITFSKKILEWFKNKDIMYSFLIMGLMTYLIQSIGVEYFASRHFWIILPVIYQYKLYIKK